MAVSLLYVRGRFFVVGVARRIDVFIDVVFVNSQIVHIKQYASYENGCSPRPNLTHNRVTRLVIA